MNALIFLLFVGQGEYDYDTNQDNLPTFANLTIENAKDILACGFDLSKTFLFSDLEYVVSWSTCFSTMI